MMKVWKGVGAPIAVNDPHYQPGCVVNWKTFSCFLSNHTTAEQHAGSSGTLFEVDLMSGRDIGNYSYASIEDHIVMLPYSNFEIVSITKRGNNGVTYIQMKEVMVPRSKKVVFWVDDEPWHNLTMIRAAEMNGVTVVCCTNTEEALARIRNYQWMIHLEGAKIRVLTDNTRREMKDGVMVENYGAGGELIKRLRDELYCSYDVLMFCGDVKRAKENLRGVRGVEVVSQVDEVYQYLLARDS